MITDSKIDHGVSINGIVFIVISFFLISNAGDNNGFHHSNIESNENGGRRKTKALMAIVTLSLVL